MDTTVKAFAHILLSSLCLLTNASAYLGGVTWRLFIGNYHFHVCVSYHTLLKQIVGTLKTSIFFFHIGIFPDDILAHLIPPWCLLLRGPGLTQTACEKYCF